MGRFSKISENTFNELQVEAGVILRTFDPKNPTLVDGAIVCATTGGINPVCTPEFTDWGEDIDNCPNNTMELKRVASYTCTLGFTALSVTEQTIKLALGATETDNASGAIKPSMNLAASNFSDIWWVGDLSNGGFAAICLKNALSTGGLSLTTSKSGKGQIAVTLTGHYSIGAQGDVPMEFYIGSVQ